MAAMTSAGGVLAQLAKLKAAGADDRLISAVAKLLGGAEGNSCVMEGAWELRELVHTSVDFGNLISTLLEVCVPERLVQLLVSAGRINSLLSEEGGGATAAAAAGAGAGAAGNNFATIKCMGLGEVDKQGHYEEGKEVELPVHAALVHQVAGCIGMLALEYRTRPLFLPALVQCGALAAFGSALQAAVAAAAAAQSMASSAGSSADDTRLVELLMCAKHLLCEPTDEDRHPTRLSFSAVQQALAEGGLLHVALPLLLDPAASPTPGVCKGVCSLVLWLNDKLRPEEREQLGGGGVDAALHRGTGAHHGQQCGGRGNGGGAGGGAGARLLLGGS